METCTFNLNIRENKNLLSSVSTSGGLAPSVVRLVNMHISFINACLVLLIVNCSVWTVSRITFTTFYCSLLTFVLCADSAVWLYATLFLVLHHSPASTPITYVSKTLRYLHTIDSRPLWHLREAKTLIQHPPNRKLPLLPWTLRDPPANAVNISETHATPQLTQTMPQGPQQ